MLNTTNQDPTMALAEIGWAGKVVLVATRMYRASYAGVTNNRFHEASRETGITQKDWDTAKQELVNRKLLKPSSALSDEGLKVALLLPSLSTISGEKSMKTIHETEILESELNELKLMVTSEGLTLAAACEELCEDVIDAKCAEAADINNASDEDDTREDREAVLDGKEAEASVINNQGFDDQIRYLYDVNDLDIVKTLLATVIANLKSKAQ